MPASSLHNLAEQFCEILGVAAPSLSPDGKGHLAFSTKVKGVNVSVTHDMSRHPDHASVLVFFGHVPPDREVLVLRELLHANLLMIQPHCLTFSRNPLTGSVILQMMFPLATASGQGLWDGLQSVISHALQWRESYFLDC